jgi:hypothetical protein
MRRSLRPIMTFALIATMAAVPAFAQSANDAGQESQYAACSGKPSQADTEAAHGAYMAGKGSFDEADYTRAINYFKDAYRRDCTKNELLVIVARAYELQGNRREAVHALETYLERVPTAQDAEVQRRHIANLKRELSEQAAASASASASVAPTASPNASAAPSASAAPTATAPEPVASSAPPPTADKGHSIAPWVVVIAGGAALVGGSGLYGVGTGQVSSAESVCGANHQCPGTSAGQSALSQGNSGRTEETVGVVVGSVGLAAVAAGLIWHFVERTGPADQKAARHPVVTPQVAPGYAGLGLSARF